MIQSILRFLKKEKEEVQFITKKYLYKQKLIAFVLGALLALSTIYYYTPTQIVEKVQIIKFDPYTNEEHRIIEHISKEYDVPIKESAEIVRLAKRHSSTFPSMYDILAIIAIESGFNKYATGTKGDKGLMQIFYKQSSYDTEQNVLDGVFLLKEYYGRLKSREATLHAYNVGISNYKRGVRNPVYLSKFTKKKENLIAYGRNNSI